MNVNRAGLNIVSLAREGEGKLCQKINIHTHTDTAGQVPSGWSIVGPAGFWKESSAVDRYLHRNLIRAFSEEFWDFLPLVTSNLRLPCLIGKSDSSSAAM